ncbi:hypothetical protein H7F15_05080 [Pontibacter sp. Tf4]|uniref:tetratricopeptide repeat protein n=1 Tax=Pontibacter sp. Tf4 TaxID=2761620 RepID=UPI001624F64E|nr:hypothetical protein [Pontibacter sp. Tf4]MBB6610404.1 hypothetical protein [Pontibacter sp. Tf4]
MKKLVTTMLACLAAVTFTLAQEQATQPDPKVLPMFGKVAKTEAQQKKDEQFLKSSDASFTTRTEASKFFMERGWEYLNEGQIDTAMYRFNLAWLLNPDSSDPYWAFGLVTVAKGNPTEAITYYEKALSLQPKNSLLLSDVANCYLAQYEQKPKKKMLKQATEFIEKSIAADAQNAYACMAMSRVQYHNQKYADAWTWLHKGRALNMTALDYNYLLTLIDKMPDPQGFFGEQTEPDQSE